MLAPMGIAGNFDSVDERLMPRALGLWPLTSSTNPKLLVTSFWLLLLSLPCGLALARHWFHNKNGVGGPTT
jgi:hypothetical protein